LDFIVFAVYCILVIVLLRKWRWFHIPLFGNWPYVGVLMVKVSVAFYLVHNPIDTFIDGPIFLDESRQLSAVLFESPADFFRLLTGFGENQEIIYTHLRETIHWTAQPDNVFNDSKNLVRLNAVLNLFSFGNIYVNLLFISLISMIGLQGIYKTVTHFTKGGERFLFLLIFLFPSAMLWTATILKEPYLLLGFGLFLYGWLAPHSKKTKIALLLIGTFFLFAIKPYMLICLAPALFAYYLYKWMPRYKLVLTSSILLVLGVVLFSLTTLLPRNLTSALSKKQFNFINLTEGGIWIKTDTNMIVVPKTEEHKFTFRKEHQNRYGWLHQETEGESRKVGAAPLKVKLYPDTTKLYIFHLLDPSGSLIEITPIKNSHSQLIKNIPEALFNVLLRPLPNDPPKKMEKWLFILENWLVWGIVLFGIWKGKQIPSQARSIILTLVIFSLMLALMIGWVTPVLGAIVRYKLPITFALIIIGWLLLYSQKKTTHVKNNLHNRSDSRIW